MASNRPVTCETKRTYFTKAAVSKAIRQLQRAGAPKLYYYKCPHCTNYHLTKMSPSDYLNRATAKRRRYMLEKAETFARKIKRGSRVVAQVGGVTAVITTFHLPEEDTEAYGCRIFTGDPDKGPYHSVVTDLYYDQRGALFESLGIAAAMGAGVAQWLTAVGLEGVTVTQ